MSFRPPDPQAPLGHELHPIHQSDFSPILGGPDYTPPGGGVWAKTVGGTAFHDRMRDVCNGAQRRDALWYVDEALKREQRVAWGKYSPESLALLVEGYCVAVDNVFRPRREDGWVAEIGFRYQDPETGYWYEGTIDLLNLRVEEQRIKSASLVDYKTGDTLPDLLTGPQHHEYSLAVKYGVLDHVPYLEGTRLLDWSKLTALPLIPRKWPKEFRFLHLPALINRGSWFALGLGSNGEPMTEADSLATMRALTRRLLDQQPTRLAVSVSAPAEPQPTIEKMQPQNTAIVPAQNHKVALEVSENIDLFRLGDVFSKSGFFVDCKDANQAVVKILAGRELGLPPFQSLSGIHVVKGKATMGATLIAARIKGSGKYDYVVIEMGEKRCLIEFFEIRSGQRIIIGKSEFTESDATKAGTQNMGKFPRNMLFARAISNGAKWFTPDIFGGPIYVPEEMEPEEPAEPIKSVAVEVAAPTPAPIQPQPIQPQPLYTFGEPRGTGYATDAQLKRIKANCDALGFSARKVLVTAVALGAPQQIVSVADVSDKVATQLVMKLDGLLKSTETPRPDREKTDAEILDEQIRQIIGDEIRTKNAKALRELMTVGNLTPDDVVDTMEAEVGADRQFNSLVEPVQGELLAALKRQANAKAERQLVATGAANGNGQH